MALLLQILGAAFLLLIALVVVGLLVLRAKLKSFASQLQSFADTFQASSTPARITLRPLATPSWDDEDAVETLAGPLPGLGFTLVGTYQVEEIDGLGLQAWVHPREDVTAVVYEHPTAGVWLDLVTRYQDGTRITLANTAQGSGVEHAPGHDVRRYPGLDTRELYARLLAERPDKPREPMPAGEFVARFEKAYADEMDWRNSRGGPSLDEIRAIAGLSGKEYDEDLIRATHQASRARALGQLGETLRERFRAQKPMSDAEWEAVEDRLVFVHDQLDAGDLESILMDYADGGEETIGDFGQDGGKPSRSRFAQLNAGLPAGRRFTRLGSVSEPIAADVYAAPEPTDDD